MIQHLLASVRSCKMGLSLAASCLSLQGLYNVGVMTLFLTPFVSNSLHFSRLARRVTVQCHCQVWGAQRQWTTSGLSISGLIITLNVPSPHSLYWPVIMTNVFQPDMQRFSDFNTPGLANQCGWNNIFISCSWWMKAPPLARLDQKILVNIHK